MKDNINVKIFLEMMVSGYVKGLSVKSAPCICTNLALWL